MPHTHNFAVDIDGFLDQITGTATVTGDGQQGSESLKDPLISLGMVDPFTMGVADFTGINTQGLLYISDVVHKAFIGVDEFGTEAAAATAVIIANTGIPDDPVEFTVDRPFLLFIRDASGAILFTGQVVDPS